MLCDNLNVKFRMFLHFWSFECCNSFILANRFFDTHQKNAYCISGTWDPKVGPRKLTRVGPKWDPEIDKGGTLKLTRVGPNWDPTIVFYKNILSILSISRVPGPTYTVCIRRKQKHRIEVSCIFNRTFTCFSIHVFF